VYTWFRLYRFKMSQGCTLYSEKDSPVLTWKILAIANYSDVSIKAVYNEVDLQSKSPIGKIPLLEVESVTIFGADAISRYVAKSSSLLGSSPLEAALVDQWVQFASKEIDMPASVWVFPILGFIKNDIQALSRAKSDVRKVFETLNKHLAARTYLVGERITIADITVASSLFRIYQLVADPSFRKAFVNVNRWFMTVVNQPKVHEVFGDVVLADKAQVAPESTDESVVAVKKKKEEKPKAEEKPKKETTPKKDDEADEEDDERFEDEAPKGKNPLDALPPPKMNMDEWKRTYSNNDTRSVAMPWLWSHFDAKDYSLWFCRYIYNDELEKTFMTCNLIGGFLQRLDKLRKYGFGSMIIFGEEPKLDIEGAWLVRGPDVPPELSTCDDYELYRWQRVDVTDDAQIKLVEDFFAWDGDFRARAAIWPDIVLHDGFSQGKIFK